jgi:hypothetical protein
MKRYLIGYIGSKQCVYGKDEKIVYGNRVMSKSSFVDTMTFRQANKAIKRFQVGAVIYEVIRKYPKGRKI